MSDRPLDTSADAHAVYCLLLRQRTGAERMRMASDMFTTARRLVLASLPEDVRADPVQRAVALLRRLYGRDLDPGVLRAAAAHVAGVDAAGGLMAGGLESRTGSDHAPGEGRGYP